MNIVYFKNCIVLAVLFEVLAVLGCSKQAEPIVQEQRTVIGMAERTTVSSDGGALSSDIAVLVIDMQNDFVDISCCTGTTPEAHNAALSVMKSCQIDIWG